jgi:ribosomal-protein-alanine N-acetyltransferase
MPDIRLVTITPDLARDLADDARAGDPPDDHAALVREVVAGNEAFRERLGAPPEWVGHLAADATTGVVVGTCAFKGPPVDGVVEIAYFTFPAFEGRGYGGAMAGALVARAAAAGEVRTVRAHTLPEPNASTRILERLGFAHLGTVEDPEDGPVWRWERPSRATTAPTTPTT